MKNGFNWNANWLIFYKDGKPLYGFLVFQKGEVKPIEPEEIETENLKGNKTGNSFITTQINYNGIQRHS